MFPLSEVLCAKSPHVTTRTALFCKKFCKNILAQNHIIPVGLVIKYTSPANLSNKFNKNLPGTNQLIYRFTHYCTWYF